MLVLLAVCLGHLSANLRAQPASPVAEGPVDTARLRSAIHAAARYLVDACQDDGRFRYRVDLNPDVEPAPGYNMLRHAGAIYALAQYQERYPKQDTRQVLLRAGSYLKTAIHPVADNPHLAAVWSLPDMVGPDMPRQAKLGGTGLGLVALLGIEQAQPGFTSLNDLRRLGRFLLYMQKPDGSFYSKFYPDCGRDDRWTSMYYPGEAALALLLLYDHDPQRQWLGGGSQALAALARSGSQRPKTFPDQWLLLATRRIVPEFGSTTALVRREELLEHVRRTCRDMLEDQGGQTGLPSIHGCYTNDGRTCPTATRLEGLLAALQFLPREERTLRRQLQESVDAGIRFLVASQINDGPYRGGFPRVACQFSGPEREMAPPDAHPTEIRIDYVQHALSALLAYESELGARDN